MQNPTLIEIGKILKSLSEHGDSPVVQKILRESFDNNNESSDTVQPSPVSDSISHRSKQDEIG